MKRDSYSNFLSTLRQHYARAGRHDLPWRQPTADGTYDPYMIIVSELMLQQTQVNRVIPKFKVFLQQFPTLSTLAAAPLKDVLIAWQGLGYNRRAKFIWQAARIIEGDFAGQLPPSQSELITLPGIGPNTAGAIVAYSFNQPVVFIETNIRSVFIHHFYPGSSTVSDASIKALVSATLDHHNPRQWYWALMDYGSYLKQTRGNLSRRSNTYTKQSSFNGSPRQIRGRIVRLLSSGPMNKATLLDVLADPRAEMVLAQLEAEGLVRHKQSSYQLP